MARVLIVDDEPDVAQHLAEELQRAGWQTGVAYNGVEAVLQVLDGGWDVALLDVVMPRLSGIDALRIIRRVAPHLPVVMFTGQAGRGDMYESTRLGAFTCLMKPVAVEKLLQTLHQAISAHGGSLR